MRARRLATVAAIASAIALIALPAASGAAVGEPNGASQLYDLRLITMTAGRDGPDQADPVVDPTVASAGQLDGSSVFVEVGDEPPAPPARPIVAVPVSGAGMEWKPPRYTMTGIATFYDHGTTAMRLPRGTVIRVCGPGGCLERVVNDYGPFGAGRIIDLYRPDFFAVCGCPSWSGTVKVTVHVY